MENLSRFLSEIAWGLDEQADDLGPAGGLPTGLALRDYARRLRAVAEYARRLEGAGGADQRRLAALEAFLAGGPPAGSSLEAFDFERHHLALIVWGAEPAALARKLAAALRRPLFTASLPGREECWGWISGTRPLDPLEERVLAGFVAGPARIAIGLEGFGEAGFRAGHRQAERARAFASTGADGQALLRYEDVVIEALAGENHEDARAF